MTNTARAAEVLWLLEPHLSTSECDDQARELAQALADAGETWNPVVGYEGLYEVSDHGRVKRIPAIIETARGPRPTPGRILKLGEHKDGYKKVDLSKSNSTRTWNVHRLVAVAFLGPCPDDLVVCHVNGNPSDNRPSNLRYGTVSENVRDEVRHGTHIETRKTACPQGHPLEGPNLQPSQWKTYGKRSCLACSRAWGYIHGRDALKPFFSQISDIYHSAILAGQRVDTSALALLSAASYAERNHHE